MARIIAGVGTSHTPAIGAAVDNGKTAEPYWAPLFKGYEPAKKWMADVKPDVVIMVYNDHVNAFDFKIIPTFAIGCADEYTIADEGWGPRPVPPVKAIPNSPRTSCSRWCSTSSTSPSSTRCRSTTA